MSKEFKSSGGHRAVVVASSFGDVHLSIHKNDLIQDGICVRGEDAPAIALAILEAAGVAPTHKEEWTVGEPDFLEVIAADLQHHIEVRYRVTKEAAERETLTRRRDDLAREFVSTPFGYADTSLGYADTLDSTQRAIDRIIELEDRATK